MCCWQSRAQCQNVSLVTTVVYQSCASDTCAVCHLHSAIISSPSWARGVAPPPVLAPTGALVSELGSAGFWGAGGSGSFCFTSGTGASASAVTGSASVIEGSSSLTCCSGSSCCIDGSFSFTFCSASKALDPLLGAAVFSFFARGWRFEASRRKTQWKCWKVAACKHGASTQWCISQDICNNYRYLYPNTYNAFLTSQKNNNKKNPNSTHQNTIQNRTTSTDHIPTKILLPRMKKL